MDAEQHLFLMEFLVDEINIPSIRAMHDEFLPVTTCVSFQILNLPAVSISEEVGTEGCECREKSAQQFKKGKSCLFALPTIVLEKPSHTFPVTLSVYKKLPADVLPDVILIGSHRIEAKDLLNDLLDQRASKVNNPSTTTKDTYRISTVTGQVVGEVTVFMRFSCFGKKIVTQFQIPHNRKPYLFKGIDNSPIFQCKRIETFESDDDIHEPLKQLSRRTYGVQQLTDNESPEENIEPGVRQCGCPVKRLGLL